MTTISNCIIPHEVITNGSVERSAIANAISLRTRFALISSLLIASLSSQATADTIVGGNLTFSLDGDAFANGADVLYIESFARLANPEFTYNTSQPFMEFARHASNAPAGRPAPAPTNFNDLRDAWVRPSSTGLEYGFLADLAQQTLTFDPATVASVGAVGSARFTGGDSFWYANDSLITPVDGVAASVWFHYGNLSLSFDPGRRAGGNSGWVFTNHVAGPLPTFDVRNPTLNSIPAGDGAGSLTLAGDLITTQEFRDLLGIQAGLDVGDFTFRGLTVVPEPSSALLAAIAGLGGLASRRRMLCE